MAAFHQQQAMQRIQQDFAAVCSPYDAQPQTYVDPRGQQHHHTAAAPMAAPMQHNDFHQQRLDALASLQMAQSRRSPSPEPREAPRSFASQQQQQQQQPAYTAPQSAVPKSNKKANRLSFNGSSGSNLLEHAMARKTSGEIPVSADFMNTSFEEDHATPTTGHTRGQSSVSSCASGRSLVLSEEHRELFSPQGPTIFLSSPGDSFMPPSRQTSGNTSSSDEDNSAISSGSDSPTEETPASSQSSLSSLASDHSKATADAPTLRRVSSNAGLNPAAMSFTPKPASPSPPPMPVSVVVTRQPKGPARDEDIEQKNFEGRRRKQALAKLKRRSFAGAA